MTNNWFELCTPVKFYNFQSRDYIWPLPDGFPPGSRVIIEGVPTVDTSDPIFSINFLTKQPCDGEGDIANHINLRYGVGSIAYNTFLADEGWQEEELHPNKSINAGDLFKITIICELTHLSLYINDNHFNDFGHRTLPEKIQCLVIGRSVTVTALTVDRINSVNWSFPNGFQEGKTVIITGFPGIYNSSEQFEINFQTFSTHEKSGDIPLRMTVQYTEGKIINSTYKSKVWEEQKIVKNLFLKPKVKFEIAISNRKSSFKIFVNDKEFTCNVEIPHDKIMYLTIRDNVYVSSIKVISKMIDPRKDDGN